MLLSFFFLTLSLASAADPVDEKCRDVADTDGDGVYGPAPDGYSEATQANFLLNYYALATTFSSLHAPIPHRPGTGSLGLELSIIPYLGCEQRLMLNYTKTEDTNKTPVLPRPRGSFAFPAKTLKNGISFVPYAGFGYVPPVPIAGTRNVMVSFESGIGVGNLKLGGIQYGIRYHATLMRTIGEVATPIEEGQETLEDLYVGSTFGVDLSAGYAMEKITPYVVVGWTDVSTVFYIDDDAVVSNNTEPYAGPSFSLGTQWAPKEFLDVAAEFYAAPVSFFALDGFAVSSAAGSIYTGRFKVAYLF